ncbi:MAG: PQQ-binding-like beta-propeller repeat protein [Planctomycetota bacterium]|nr:PQQ-binding-like beta-propeller repeat protein [Planctomycetota bacterium]
MSKLISALSIFLSCPVFSADWPFYRGPNRDGTSSEKLSLREGPPKKVWSNKVGKGNSSVTLASGRLYTSCSGRTDNLVCLDTKTGERIWSQTFKTWHGDSTPAVADGRVYILASHEISIIHCFDAEKGTPLWSRELSASLQDRTWGHSGSPCIWKDRVFFNVGQGVALRSIDGQVIWEHKGFSGMATPIVFTWRERPTVAFFSGDQLIARDVENGSELWSIPWKTTRGVNACDPVIFDDKIFLCSDYGLGRALYDISGDQPKELWSFGKGCGHAYASGFHKDGELYGFMPGGFSRFNLKTGEPEWSDGDGISALLIGDKLLRLGETGELSISEFSRNPPTGVRREQIIEQSTRNVPAYSDGCLYVRNEQGTVCCFLISD